MGQKHPLSMASAGRPSTKQHPEVPAELMVIIVTAALTSALKDCDGYNLLTHDRQRQLFRASDPDCEENEIIDSDMTHPYFATAMSLATAVPTYENHVKDTVSQHLETVDAEVKDLGTQWLDHLAENKECKCFMGWWPYCADVEKCNCCNGLNEELLMAREKQAIVAKSSQMLGYEMPPTHREIMK